MREPGPHHPITITPHPGRVRVILGGTVVAESDRALALHEAGYAPVLYIPRADIEAAALAPCPQRSHCPYKGEASYFDLSVGGVLRPAAGWSYENPFPAVSRIRRHIAFYPDRVDAIKA